MKLFITSAVAALIATSAFAGNSDRYDDLRFDTAQSAQQVEPATEQAVAVLTSLSSRSKNSTSGTYAYTNPYGIGPNNDSR
ncbi:hypothetical protein [Pseudosulfitobacter sp. SM2401]|uniref:hypothetical protein n=1 Tax=Pseudosulfitobacter sp. SM2401 TaxID=3350098 RepID=UPI0036F34FC2